MICPICKCYDSAVLDSRQNDDGMIRRRRKCLNCGNRYSTLELSATRYEKMVEFEETVTKFLNLKRGSEFGSAD